ncbi:exported hypothetical protein [Candidatus Propionivibrio aalborgensis]|uniref:Uncharacterized protein n=1 Tax=Candidatus Propionivibrio aalborgensis TaxID=1860101 RepID=A0A1A8XHF8_9RHOO|nr:exported hypothetical protein [Candidatus Propionivibrio aalborgensis]
MQTPHIKRQHVICSALAATPAAAVSTHYFFTLKNLPKSFGKLDISFSLILAESLALPSVSPVLMVPGFMRREAV